MFENDFPPGIFLFTKKFVGNFLRNVERVRKIGLIRKCSRWNVSQILHFHDRVVLKKTRRVCRTVPNDEVDLAEERSLRAKESPEGFERAMTVLSLWSFLFWSDDKCVLRIVVLFEVAPICCCLVRVAPKRWQLAVSSNQTPTSRYCSDADELFYEIRSAIATRVCKGPPGI